MVMSGTFDELLDYAATLPLNTHTRVAHCGTRASAVVSHDDTGVRVWCYKCGEGAVEAGIRQSPHRKALTRLGICGRDGAGEWPPEQHSIDEVARIKLPPAEYMIELPDIPDDYKPLLDAFLANVGCSMADAAELGMYWDKAEERVVLPLRDRDGVLCVLHARRMGAHGPKYLTSVVPGRVALVDAAQPYDRDVVIVTEDPYSAYHCAKQGVDALPLMSTTPTDDAWLAICQYKLALLWLDPDTAGVSSMIQLRREHPFWPIWSPTEPKHTPSDVLRKRLRSAIETWHKAGRG